MTKLLNEALLTRAIMNFAVTETGKAVVDAYIQYDKYEDNMSATKFEKSLCRLNSLNKKHGFGNFILKALNSDEDSIRVAQEAYDVINCLVANECQDSYTKVAK